LADDVVSNTYLFHSILKKTMKFPRFFGVRFERLGAFLAQQCAGFGPQCGEPMDLFTQQTVAILEKMSPSGGFLCIVFRTRLHSIGRGKFSDIVPRVSGIVKMIFHQPGGFGDLSRGRVSAGATHLIAPSVERPTGDDGRCHGGGRSYPFSKVADFDVTHVRHFASQVNMRLMFSPNTAALPVVG